MKKISVVISGFLLVSMTMFSQTTKDNIEKLSKDPKTTENAAKADVYIMKNKRIISDTTTRHPSDPAITKTTRKKKKR